MKRILISCITLLCSIGAFAQADESKEVRNVTGFTGISVANGIELIVKEGADAVTVSASTAEVRDKIKTVVESGTLKIYYDNGKVYKALDKSKKMLKAYVSIQVLNQLVGRSGASISFDGEITTGTFNVNMSEGSSFKGKFNSSDFTIDLSSGASATLTGTATAMNIKCSSGAHFYGFELTSQTCNAEVNSGAKVEITVNKELAAKASSGAKVKYKGSAMVKNISLKSGGKVSKA